jgi:RNA recognition motif-containing protein
MNKDYSELFHRRMMNMSKKIYVGNLSYDTTEESLRTLFATHGEVVSVRAITDRMTGRSKGFAFVEMADDSEAKAAINALNGTDLDGRSIKVNEAVDKARDGYGQNNYSNRRY